MKWFKSLKFWTSVAVALTVLVGLFYLPWCGIVGGDQELIASVPTSVLMLHLGTPDDVWVAPPVHHELLYRRMGVDFEKLKKDRVKYSIRRLEWNVTRWPNGIGEYSIVMTFLETSNSTQRIKCLCFRPEEFDDVY